jgi:hypothetical protein
MQYRCVDIKLSLWIKAINAMVIVWKKLSKM